ncbi:uncharacterized protein PG998_006419 [Apiospora kogelbergensis]|uniref:uncharacterized protein n=1 Tax=Apiospora kogelbergensis TaxID=1337665 RepID=UPI00312EA392
MSQSDKPNKTPTKGLPQRKDIRNLSTEEQNNLITAFKAIQALEPDHPDSFFKIASYHGAPFRGAGYANQNWWGGYCNHGNILFPTWHRAYTLRLEQSLERHGLKIKLPYWNELEEMTKEKPWSLPEIFLKPKWQIKGDEPFDNPLYSYKYQHNIVDHASPKDGVQYTKPKGYTTVRYPFTGLYGPRDIEDSKYHNKYYQNLKDKFYEEQEKKKKLHEEPLGDQEEPCNKLLNDNIRMWLEDDKYPPDVAPPHSRTAKLKRSYHDCLKVEDYTVFSNTTSAQAWNDQYYHDQEGNKDKILVSLETPHNGMHLALGGVEVPSQLMSYVRNANGDMGENNTAAFDPIFYFHHSFIDLIFWKWQLHNHSTTELKIDKKFEDYPGTSSVDGQGPTPGMTGADFLSMDTPLRPFHKVNDPDPNKPLQLSTDREDPFLKSKVCG